jgi:hypothetical protein
MVKQVDIPINRPSTNKPIAGAAHPVSPGARSNPDRRAGVEHCLPDKPVESARLGNIHGLLRPLRGT